MNDCFIRILFCLGFCIACKSSFATDSLSKKINCQVLFEKLTSEHLAQQAGYFKASELEATDEQLYFRDLLDLSRTLRSQSSLSATQERFLQKFRENTLRTLEFKNNDEPYLLLSYLEKISETPEQKIELSLDYLDLYLKSASDISNHDLDLTTNLLNKLGDLVGFASAPMGFVTTNSKSGNRLLNLLYQSKNEFPDLEPIWNLASPIKALNSSHSIREMTDYTIQSETSMPVAYHSRDLSSYNTKGFGSGGVWLRPNAQIRVVGIFTAPVTQKENGPKGIIYAIEFHASDIYLDKGMEIKFDHLDYEQVKKFEGKTNLNYYGYISPAVVKQYRLEEISQSPLY